MAYNQSRDWGIDEAGICIYYNNPDFQRSEVSLIVTDVGGIFIFDTVSKQPVSKEFFLDLMSKLYDMAEVK